MYCAGCKIEHTDTGWKHRDGWYCSKFFTPIRRPEFVPGRLLDDRVEYFNSNIQPFRQGKLSKEYVETYGTDRIDVTPEEISKAKDVWKDLPGWDTRDKSL